MQAGEHNPTSPQASANPIAPILVELHPPQVDTPAPDDAALQVPASVSQGHHGWTFMLMSLGIGLIACCLLLPEIDGNRRLFYECEKLKVDLEHLKQQVEVNGQFIASIGRDPSLSQRLAQRQMKFIRKGSRILELKGDEAALDSSPFTLVSLPPPPSLPELRPTGGYFMQVCRDPKKRLYLIAAGLMLMAMGLVLGANDSKDAPAA